MGGIFSVGSVGYEVALQSISFLVKNMNHILIPSFFDIMAVILIDN